ncbi:inner-membrane translocator, partial [mine drainage metagenome]
LYGFTGYLPFGYVGFYGIGAYGASLAMLDLHLAPVPALVFGMVVAVVLALILMPLLRLSGAYFSIASLAASQAIYYVISNPSLIGLTNGPYGISLAASYDATASYIAMAVILGLSVAIVLYLRRSRFGMTLQAIRDDPISAEMAGVSVVRERTIAWLLSA